MPISLFELRSGSPSQGKNVSNILLPLDGSALSRAAIPVARHLAELYNATAHLVYAREEAIEPGKRMERLGVDWNELPGAVVDQSAGPAPEIVLGLTHKLGKSLVVMCTHTGRKSNHDAFGSVTEAVLAGNPERIVLVAPDISHAPFCIRTLVLCHDGTPSATVATGPALELAHLSGAEVIAALVATPCADCPDEIGSLPAPQYIDQPQHEWPTWVQEFGMRMLRSPSFPGPLKFELVVSAGQPGSELTQLARKRGADLVIMAVSGDWKRSKHKVARVVAENSGCPVLFVRQGGVRS